MACPHVQMYYDKVRGGITLKETEELCGHWYWPARDTESLAKADSAQVIFTCRFLLGSGPVLLNLIAISCQYPIHVGADEMVQGRNGKEKFVLLYDLVNHLVVITQPILALAPFSNSLCEALGGSQLENVGCHQSNGSYLIICTQLCPTRARLQGSN